MFESWFGSWGPWAWVALAWAELLLTYGGYLLYLRRRAKRAGERQ